MAKKRMFSRESPSVVKKPTEYMSKVLNVQLTEILKTQEVAQHAMRGSFGKRDFAGTLLLIGYKVDL